MWILTTGLTKDRTVSVTCSKGPLPRVYVGGGASSSESGTRFVEPVLLIGRRGGRRLVGGGLRRRVAVDWVSFSYSTDVLRGKFVLRVAPVTQASFGLVGAGGGMGFSVVAAWWKALAI